MSGVPIRVLLVDNHPLVRDGLRGILETYAHIAVVGAAGDALDGLEQARMAQPNVVLLDINLPKVSGIQAIEMFRAALPACRLLMLSMHDSREYISSSVIRGAAGYVLKDVPTEEIIRAIETVASGGTFFSSGVADAILERGPKPDEAGLTAREVDVLRHIFVGRNNRDIAEMLGLSTATVETHRKNLKKKLGIASTAGLVRYAMERGIGSGDP